MDLAVTSPRPLADAARVLEQRFRRVVTYEDTLYLHPDDTIRDEGGRLIPRGGRMAIQYEDTAGLPSVIDKIVETYTRSQLPGAFAVDHQSGDHHIVPRSFRSDRGTMEARLPLLDATISIPAQAQERDGLRLVEEIARRAGAARGETISVGTVPTNALAQHRAAGRASSGTARDLLMGLFRDMGRLCSWQLLNNPGTREFVLNIHHVPMG
jgi:hypothetical protein